MGVYCYVNSTLMLTDIKTVFEQSTMQRADSDLH